MLPQVTLRKVTRVDIDRVGWWLNDNDISSRWFGHYQCGDPVHRGYDPEHMLEASEAEWNQVFNDEHRLIMSIYNEHDEHIGECFVAFDGEGRAELSILIGKKELWHRGYGTATVFYLLDNTFTSFNLDRVWVSIPEENTPALGLFEKFGFVMESKRELCRNSDNEEHRASILGLNMNQYRARLLSSGLIRPRPVISITGLSGSRSREVAAAVARLSGGRMADSEIREGMLKRLRCSNSELEALEHSFTSKWASLLHAFAVPVAWPGTHEPGNHFLASEAFHENAAIEKTVSKKQYVDALSGVIKQLALESDMVLHGSGIHQFIPTRVSSISVFLSASPELRASTVDQTTDIGIPNDATIDEVGGYLKDRDRDNEALCKNLLEIDLMDMSQYDLIVNLDRLTVEPAARVIVNAILLAEGPDASKTVPAVSANQT